MLEKYQNPVNPYLSGMPGGKIGETYLTHGESCTSYPLPLIPHGNSHRESAVSPLAGEETSTTAGGISGMECATRQSHTGPTPEVSHLSSLLALFEKITIDELRNSDAQLLSRREKKFLMTVPQCVSLISGLTRSYRALDIEDSRVGRYETMYYDTESFQAYLQHHNGKANRFKLRFRHYCSTDETYLEVKERQNTGRTVKKRIETDGIPDLSEKNPKTFLESAFPYDSSEFHPVLTTGYSRATLVSNDSRERITFDFCPSFCRNGTTYSYPGVVVGEIKYDRSLFKSPGLTVLRRMGIRKTAFSKYCIGVSLLYTGLKHNRFKPLMLHLETLSRGGIIPW